MMLSRNILRFILVSTLLLAPTSKLWSGVNFYHMKEFKRDAIIAIEEVLLNSETSPKFYRLQVLLHKLKQTYGEYTNSEYTEELLTMKALITESLAHIPRGDAYDSIERLKLYIEAKLSIN